MTKKILVITIVLIMLSSLVVFADEIDELETDVYLIEPRAMASCPVNGYHDAYIHNNRAWVHETPSGDSIFTDVYVCIHCNTGLYIDQTNWSNYYIGPTYSGTPYDQYPSTGSINHDGSENMFRYLGWTIHK